MDRNQAKEFYPILQAFIDGKELEVYSPSENAWVDVKIKDEIYLGNNYRIKPESTYRPFANAEECWTVMQNHQPFGWVKDKQDGHRVLITAVNDDTCGKLLNGNAAWSSSKIMDIYTFADGAPFGVKVEE